MKGDRKACHSALESPRGKIYRGDLVVVAQWFRALPCGGRGWEFESPRPPQTLFHS